MAYSILSAIRNPGLDTELGIATADDATDTTFGTTAARNFYLQRAFAKLWPDMARLTREDVTTVEKQTDYTLTTLRDIERISVLDTAGLEGDQIKSWQLYEDEAADPIVKRLLIPRMAGGLTLRCIGYAPYIVPAADGSACDLPPRLEYVVCAGARVEAYRAKVNSFANFKNFQNENRTNAISVGELLDLMRSAERDFARYKLDNRRELTGAKRAMRQVR